jgi:hypothetical protein
MTTFLLVRATALFIAVTAVLGTGQLSAQQTPTHETRRHVLDLTLIKPESVGFSSERLERLHSLMQQSVDQKQIAGIVTILARHGKVVDYRTYGYRDMASGAAMTKDTIFRDFSMTKPVTGVAMMILYEQGKWLPSDPIAKYIPEFAHLKVFKGVDADGKIVLEDPDHAPTMRELMSHTAGFTYGIFGDTPGGQDVSRCPCTGFEESAGDDRQGGAAAAVVSAGQGLDLFDLDGYRGLHRGEALGADAAGFYSRPHLSAAGHAGRRILCTGGEAQPLCDALYEWPKWRAWLRRREARAAE